MSDLKPSLIVDGAAAAAPALAAAAVEDDVVTLAADGEEAAPAAAAAAAPADPEVAVVAADADDDKLPKQAIVNRDGSITLPLAAPVVLRWRKQGGADVTEEPPIAELVMRRLTGKDVRVILSSGMGDDYPVKLTKACVAGMSNIKQSLWPQIFDRMDGADAAAAVRIAQHFLESGPKTPGR